MYSEFVKEVQISELDDSQKNRDLLKNIKIERRGKPLKKKMIK